MKKLVNYYQMEQLFRMIQKLTMKIAIKIILQEATILTAVVIQLQAVTIPTAVVIQLIKIM